MAEVVAVARALLAVVEVVAEVAEEVAVVEEVAEVAEVDTGEGAKDLHRPVASPLGLPTFTSVGEDGVAAAAQ